MKKIVIIGADNKTAQLVEKNLENLVTMVLIIKSNVNISFNNSQVFKINQVSSQDLVNYLSDANLIFAIAGISNMIKDTQAVLEAAKRSNVKRIIWVATPGLYTSIHSENRSQTEENYGDLEDENSFIGSEKVAIKIIQTDPEVNSTIICPNYITDNKNIENYSVTNFKEHATSWPISRATVARFCSDLILNSDQYNHSTISIGHTK
ncbi:NAD(P)H-binding protein [Lentilactobacillus laojiaonis]|uniref:NAD(P)H-binding protein n=1 Tax=Lentilactobacillus laojiaonis TaxID=2883998 RepID=UPI001D0A32D3|nr:NAD(P)H-binding protein [Lentilactobacillus laojiaonis]UDM32311.1 NAD(P)H-binding protein [Lentilactobacillus laojiaonis]